MIDGNVIGMTRPRATGEAYIHSAGRHRTCQKRRIRMDEDMVKVFVVVGPGNWDLEKEGLEGTPSHPICPFSV